MRANMLAECDVYNGVSSASTKLLGAMYVLPRQNALLPPPGKVICQIVDVAEKLLSSYCW